MFFYSAQPRALQRLSIAPQGAETRLVRQIAEVIAKPSTASTATENERQRKEQEKDQGMDNADQHRNITIRSSSLADTSRYSTSDIQLDKKSNRHYYRRPTVTIQSDGRITIGGLGRISLPSA